MKSTPKWLLIPPAVAILLILGPMSMSGDNKSTPSKPASVQPSSVQPTTSTPAGNQAIAKKAADEASIGKLVPRTPNMWKMSGAFVGVLLLGVGALMVLKRMRGGAVPKGSTSLATLRQTVRLTTKQSLHAIEFDNRILLIGESEKGLSLIDRGNLPDAASDEAQVLARHQEEEDDEGAVPRNLIIPRPENPPQRKPTAPAVNPAVAPTKADAAVAKLNDFRTLLQKAGR